MKLVAWFGELSKKDVALVGGKGANLGELNRAGIPVPSGFCVTADAYFRFLDAADLRPRIEELLRDLDVNDSPRLQETSNEIKCAHHLRPDALRHRRPRSPAPTAR